MFDIGWSEILVIVIITILVVGPKELPGLLRTIGKTVGNMRRMAGDLQNQFNDALKEAELDEVKNAIGDVRKLNPANAVKDAVGKQLADIGEATNEVSKDLKASSNEINAEVASSGGAKNTETADLVDDEPPAAAPALIEAEQAAAEADALTSKEKSSGSKDEITKAD